VVFLFVKEESAITNIYIYIYIYKYWVFRN
jgi:hypothetical protein